MIRRLFNMPRVYRGEHLPTTSWASPTGSRTGATQRKSSLSQHLLGLRPTGSRTGATQPRTGATQRVYRGEHLPTTSWASPTGSRTGATQRFKNRCHPAEIQSLSAPPWPSAHRFKNRCHPAVQEPVPPSAHRFKNRCHPAEIQSLSAPPWPSAHRFKNRCHPAVQEPVPPSEPVGERPRGYRRFLNRWANAQEGGTQRLPATCSLARPSGLHLRRRSRQWCLSTPMS